MSETMSVGTDHCRVTEPGPGDDLATVFEYYRHLFPYAEVARRARAHAELLEVGCGAGYGANYLASKQANVTATDTSQQAITYASATYPGVRFAQAHGTALPFDAESFEIVVSFQVVEHVAEVERYVDEIWRVLRPGGALYLTTPNRRLRLLPYQRPWNPYHVREYTDRGLLALLHRRFDDARLSGVIARPDLMTMEMARVRQRPLMVLLGPIYRRVKPLLPSTLISAAATRVVRRAAPSAGSTSNADAAVSLSDISLSDDTRACLDLFCEARKPGDLPPTITGSR